MKRLSCLRSLLNTGYLFNNLGGSNTPIKPLIMDNPKEITQDCDTGVNIASFDYYTGIQWADAAQLPQTTSMSDVIAGTHFIVCCGDVMVKVEPTDFPEMTRRIF